MELPQLLAFVFNYNHNKPLLCGNETVVIHSLFLELLLESRLKSKSQSGN